MLANLLPRAAGRVVHAAHKVLDLVPHIGRCHREIEYLLFATFQPVGRCYRILERHDLPSDCNVSGALSDERGVALCGQLIDFFVQFVIVTMDVSENSLEEARLLDHFFHDVFVSVRGYNRAL